MIITGAGTITIVLTLRHTSDSADAARDAAKAAMESVKVAREIGQKQVRAYVGTKNVMLHDFVVGKHPTFVYTLINSGQTPAYGLQVNVVAYFFEGEAPKNFFSHVAPNSIVDLVAGGSSHAPVKWPEPLTAEAFQSFKTGNHKLLFMGYMNYRDVFGKLRRAVFSNKLDFEDLRLDGPAMMSVTRKHNRSN